MKAIKENKVAQTIVGAGVIYISYLLWRDGWFSAFFSDPAEGMRSSQLAWELAAAVLSFVQLVGIVTMGVAFKILPHVDDVAAGALRWLRATVPSLWARWKSREPRAKESFDWRPLAALALVWVLWNGGHLHRAYDWAKNLIVKEEVLGKPQAVIFVIGSDITADQMDVVQSRKIDQLLMSLKIERRAVRTSQDVSNSEEWLQNAVSAAKGRSALVVAGEALVVRDIPADAGKLAELIQSWR